MSRVVTGWPFDHLYSGLRLIVTVLLTASDKAYPQNWIGYSASEFPFNVTSIKYESATKFSITFSKAYNHYWMLYNELSQIYPFPTYAWDKTSESSPVGSYDLTPAGRPCGPRSRTALMS